MVLSCCHSFSWLHFLVQFCLLFALLMSQVCGSCGHLKASWDNHPRCFACSRCSFQSRCQICKLWPSSICTLASNRRSYVQRKVAMDKKKMGKKGASSRDTVSKTVEGSNDIRQPGSGTVSRQSQSENSSQSVRLRGELPGEPAKSPDWHFSFYGGNSCRSNWCRASVKLTYDVYYALRLPPDVQIELQRRTADFRNFFCPSEIDTRDVQKLSKGPTFNQLYDVCPAFLPVIRYLCWLSFKTSRFPLAGVLLTAVSSVAEPFWWLRDHCVYLSRVLSWLIDVFIIKFSTATPKIFVEIIWSHYYFLIFTS